MRSQFYEYQSTGEMILNDSILQAGEQYIIVQDNTAEYSSVQFSTAQCSTVEYCTVQCNTVQCATVLVQHSIPQYNTVLVHLQTALIWNITMVKMKIKNEIPQIKKHFISVS